MDSFSDFFFNVYPEFYGSVSAERVDLAASLAWAQLDVLNFGRDTRTKLGTCYVVAHFLSDELSRNSADGEKEIGGGTGGAVTSASVDGVSASFLQIPPKDQFESFFMSTVYGKAFLAWLALIGGIWYVN